MSYSPGRIELPDPLRRLASDQAVGADHRRRPFPEIVVKHQQMVGDRVERVGVAPRGRGDGVRPGAHLLEEDAEAKRETGVGFSRRPGEPHAEVPRPQLLEHDPRGRCYCDLRYGARHHGARTPVESPASGRSGRGGVSRLLFGERLRLHIRSWCRCFRQRASALRHRPLGHRLGRPRSEARCRRAAIRSAMRPPAAPKQVGGRRRERVPAFDQADRLEAPLPESRRRPPLTGGRPRGLVPRPIFFASEERCLA